MTYASEPEYVIHDILIVFNPNDPRWFKYLTHWEGERQDEAIWERYESFVPDGEVAQPFLDFMQQQQGGRV
jgi:hypothetical protein